ncbi:MAG: caspase family protein [Deltaproteobacteria bacterium]|nr:caspase family protein [Deltaproteobacteria bacterium]
MTRALLALPLVVGLLAPGSAAAEEVVRRAIVVGANEGGSLLEKLQYAEADARRFSGVLQDLGGFAPEELELLVSPTVAELSSALQDAAKASETAGKTLFLFYYSGHADQIGLQIAGEHLPYRDLKDAIRAVPADVHLGILDACRSGAITNIKGASVADPFMMEEPLSVEGEAWIAASAATEDAQESDLLQGSFFTYYLVSGMRGAADTGDGWVSLDEAYSYAYERTVARTAGTQGGTQHPYYDFKMQGNGQLKLTEVRLATATISFPADMAGEVAVLRLPERTPIAEVAKPEGRVVTLALEPGAYLLRRRVEGGVQEVTISLSEGSELVVDRWGDTEVEMASRKGGTADENEYVYISSPIKWDPDLQKLKLDLTRIGEGLKESPGVAGGLSVIPGLGQAYNGRWARAAGFLSATIALHSIGWTATTGPAGSLTGPNVLTFLAFATHGWAVSDAIWNVHRQEDFRPMAGVTISAETSWVGAPDHPWSSGISVDIFPTSAISIGLDHAGLVLSPSENRYTVGTRVTLGPNTRRMRLAALFGLGTVVINSKDSEGGSSGWTEVLGTQGLLSISVGALARYYLTPRYFVQAEGRSEWLDGESHGVWGLGMGFHIGR